MATITPFRALRPRPGQAAAICALPYDVMSTEEARRMAEGNPLSFLHVSRPEIDLAEGADPYAPEVYAKGRENLDKLVAGGSLRRDEAPALYLYRQVMDGHAQTGIVALASCREYQQNIVRKHEFTRPQKEDDRVRHIEALDAQTGPVFLTYQAQPEIDGFVARACEAPSAVDFTADDGVRHTAWEVTGAEDIAFLVAAFARLPALYIADGHHRSAAAARVHEARSGAGGSDGFLTVIFPHNQMQILSYNRAVQDLNGLTAEAFLAELGKVFTVVPGGPPTPVGKHRLAVYLGGAWHGLEFKPALTGEGEPVDLLDVSLLQHHILGPVLGIDDPRTSERIAFVGGIRGTGELEAMVDSGQFACAFSLFPTRIEDLMEIADGGGVMPPKSTWFEPKLRDAMFCHVLDPVD